MKKILKTLHRFNCFLQDDEEESRTYNREAPTRKLRDEPPKDSYGGKSSLDDLKSSVSTHNLCLEIKKHYKKLTPTFSPRECLECFPEGSKRGSHDPVSRTNLDKLHVSRGI